MKRRSSGILGVAALISTLALVGLGNGGAVPSAFAQEPTDPTPTPEIFLPPPESVDPTAIPTITPDIGEPATPVPPRTLSGAVALRPAYHEIVTTPETPYQFLVVLDVSGSMSYTPDGEGTLSGANVRCESLSPSALPYSTQCTGGANAAWHEPTERRIYKAKQLVNELIDQLHPNDSMRIIAFSSGRGYSGNTQVLPASGWTSDAATLRSIVLQAGMYANDPYRTQGGSAHAQAISKALQVLQVAPTTAPNGETYRPVVMFIADGPANVFLDGTTNYARDVCPDLTRQAALDNTECQIGYSNEHQQYRPITASLIEANNIKVAIPSVQIYTIPLLTYQELGMENIASTFSNTYFYNTPQIISTIMSDRRAPSDVCIEHVSSEWVSSIDAAHTPALDPARWNKVHLFRASDNTYMGESAITADPQTGQLRYSFSNIPDGDYLVRASVGYKSEDGISRVYQSVGLAPEASGAERVPLTISGSTTAQPLYLQLGGSPCPYY
ncbi:VWA domain-containing protein [Chloroflexia bacterium SDU3-3]|nr:VWA domain-containing protein [Chloroflexia bacterium SDU3-3]